MIAANFLDLRMSAAIALGDHLWQSTLLALAVAMLAFSLKGKQARVRYWLRLAASLKFLVPFSLLVSVGKHLASSSAVTNTQFHFLASEVGQAFAPPIVGLSPVILSTRADPSWIHALPVIAGLTWFGGFTAVVVTRCIRWRKLSKTIRRAVPLHAGREVEALCRAENTTTRGTSLPVLLSSSALEPGIFGVVRPVLVWPKGISEHLDDSHLDAIVAHELWHVRRRDNLVATIHMFVEALFWFHPLVWWVGAKMVEERERACDERVLQSGSEREVYAESILKVCRFCATYPIPCVSRVTGADLKKRIVHIMSRNPARDLSLSTKLLLGTLAVLVVLSPMVFGMVNAMPLWAETTTQRPEVEAQSTPLTTVEVINPSEAGAREVSLGPDVQPRKAVTKKKVCAQSLRQALSASAQDHSAGRR